MITVILLSILAISIIIFCFCFFRAFKFIKILEEKNSFLRRRIEDQRTKIQKKNSDYIKMQESVIEGMATLIEYRDVNTGGHIQNTKFYAQLITDYLYDHNLHKDEVTPEFKDMIGNAAAMHDIGKISITDRILNKPSKLDETERETMKTHAVIGAALVRQIFGKSLSKEILRLFIDTIQYHHEKWDGSGYPLGLKGDEIPLSARITAIADVFDALVSMRVYKEKIPAEEAFEMLEKSKGTHFDPELTEIFLSLKPQILKHLNMEENSPKKIA